MGAAGSSRREGARLGGCRCGGGGAFAQDDDGEIGGGVAEKGPGAMEDGSIEYSHTFLVHIELHGEFIMLLPLLPA